MAVIIAIPVLIWLVLYVTKGSFLRAPFENVASRIAYRPVTVSGDFQLYFDPLDIKFVADGLRIGNPDWASRPHLFQADHVLVRLSTLKLLFGERVIKRLEIDRGAADLEWSEDGKSNSWTLGDPSRPSQPLRLPEIIRGQASATTVHYRNPAIQLVADIGINMVAARDTRFTSEIAFSGSGSLRARPFTLSGRLLSPNETVAGGQNRLALHAVAADTVMDVNGTLPGATRIEGADLAVQVRGRNLADLFDFIGVAVPETRRYRLRSALTYRDAAWHFTRLRGTFGDSDLRGRLTVAMPDQRVRLKADLTTDSLHMIDVGPFIGYDPARLESRGAAGTISRENGTPRILPDAPLRIEAIRNFDADVVYKVRAVRPASVPISNVGLVLSLDHSLLKLSPLTFDMAGGFLSSDVVIDARSLPVRSSYDIRLSPTPMGRLLARWGVAESGTTGTIRARVQLTGTGDTVHESLATSNGRIAIVLPKGAMWARNAQLSELDVGVFIQKMFEKKLKEPVRINCGLIAFTVRNGVAVADPILIDTTKNVMLGRGSFSFKDESLNLALRADGKKFSLFSGQSPIGVKGYFAGPAIDPISPELLARAGAGLALGVFASPFAAILSFIDVGDAKSAACGPVLAGAKAIAQRTTKGEPRKDVGRGVVSQTAGRQ
ncbi:MAG TPA: AsmA family protein [Sphingobium sp.]|nr:AsmA family protein [Sphingobium sp.]